MSWPSDGILVLLRAVLSLADLFVILHLIVSVKHAKELFFPVMAVDSQQLYHQIGLLSVLISALSIATLAVVVPLVYARTDFQRMELSEYAFRFRVRPSILSDIFGFNTETVQQSSDSIWSEMFAFRGASVPQIEFFSRRPRKAWLDSGICRGSPVYYYSAPTSVQRRAMISTRIFERAEHISFLGDFIL